LVCGLGRIDGKNRKSVFEFLETKMEEFKMNLNSECKCLNFLKDRNLETDQGFRSNEFELKVWNILK
jgi:hypothetical protein